jgi:6-phosphogluconolactonase
VKVEILPDAAAACRRAAERLCALVSEGTGARPRFVMALSGGTTPWPMLDDLAAQALDWRRVHIVQTDERLVGPDDPARNLTQLRAHLVSHVPLASDQVHPMPVDAEPPEDGAARYAALLAELAGTPPVLDVVHLGLGSDGHTASLVPGDPVLDIVGQDVATSAAYGGCRRMTLTVPAINRSRNVLWLVTGAGKAEALARLLDADPAMPAARIERKRAVVVADRAAARATLRQG